LSDYDFLDFGASSGGSLEFGRGRLGGARGLGIDIDPHKLQMMRAAGYECVHGDVTSLALPADSVRFVVMSHLLEHLSGLPDIQTAISSAAGVASDFLFISGPYFDADDYLESVGVRLFWSHWTGHTYHLRVTELAFVLTCLGLSDHLILLSGPIPDSSHPAVHPLASPIDQHEYNPQTHPPKPLIQFDRPVFQELICFARLRPFAGWAELVGPEKEGRHVFAETV
jgi:hypothetical protein